MIDRHLSVEQAVLLSRLEEEYQVGNCWVICFFFFILLAWGFLPFSVSLCIGLTEELDKTGFVLDLSLREASKICCFSFTDALTWHLPWQYIMYKTWKFCLFFLQMSWFMMLFWPTLLTYSLFNPINVFLPPPSQIRRWGNVEWAHDYDMYELRARTAAGALFVHLTSESSTVKHKLLQDWKGLGSTTENIPSTYVV